MLKSPLFYNKFLESHHPSLVHPPYPSEIYFVIYYVNPTDNVLTSFSKSYPFPILLSRSEGLTVNKTHKHWVKKGILLSSLSTQWPSGYCVSAHCPASTPALSTSIFFKINSLISWVIALPLRISQSTPIAVAGIIFLERTQRLWIPIKSSTAYYIIFKDLLSLS